MISQQVNWFNDHKNADLSWVGDQKTRDAASPLLNEKQIKSNQSHIFGHI